MLIALFGIEDGNLNLAVNLLVLFLVVVWLALVWWTFADARRRIEDPVLVGVATIASLFPFVGTLVYSILRPPEFLVDKREREFDTQAAELQLRQLAETSCPRCKHPIERSWLRCPECQGHLKDPCASCSRPVDPAWTMCPYCESQLAQPEPPAAERRGLRPPRKSRGSREETVAEKETAPLRKSRPSSSRRTPSGNAGGGERSSSSGSSGGEQPTRSSSKSSSATRRKPEQSAADSTISSEPASIRPTRRKPSS